MKLTVLVDNNTFIDRYFFAEPGVSYLIEDSGKKILFDVGYSDIFIKNAEKMNLNLLDIDSIVLSHGHSDHIWGLNYLIPYYTEKKMENIKYKIPSIIAHNNAFNRKLFDDMEIGSIISQEVLENNFNMNLSKDVSWITEKLLFLGEITRKNDFEGKDSIGKVIIDDKVYDDYILDDTAIVYKSSEGLVIITGCSHSGICNIIEYAKKVCNEHRILDVIGGFHLLDVDKNKLNHTLEYIKNQNIKKMHPCHCTDLKSKIELSKVVKIEEVGVGLNIEYI